ncbi:MAG: MarR family transcriptional regulator [Candidatus Hydrogenedentes bacterium]|nr:MarR family transcriptional regulator [Candidatus Hydrogenedentota bacterium]
MSDPTQTQAREIYRTVRLLKDRLCHKFQARAREGGSSEVGNELTFVQSNVLMAIDERGELSVKELADALHVTPPSASAMVDRLVELGMVIREQSQQDRREVRIRLSETGAVHFQEMEGQILEYISALLIQLGPSCSAQWCEVYARIREIIAAEMRSELGPLVKKEGVG